MILKQIRWYNSSAQKSPFSLPVSFRMKATVFTIIHKALHNLVYFLLLLHNLIYFLLFYSILFYSLLFFYCFKMLGTFSAQGLCTWLAPLPGMLLPWFFAWFTLSLLQIFCSKVTVTFSVRFSEDHFIENSFIFLLSSNL